MRTMEKVAMSNQRVREWSGTPGHGAISRGSDGLKEDLMGENVMQEFSIINIAGLKLWKQNWIYRRISICCSRSREIWEILASSWHGTCFKRKIDFEFTQTDWPIGGPFEKSIHPVLKSVKKLVLKYGKVVRTVQNRSRLEIINLFQNNCNVFFPLTAVALSTSVSVSEISSSLSNPMKAPL